MYFKFVDVHVYYLFVHVFKHVHVHVRLMTLITFFVYFSYTDLSSYENGLLPKISKVTNY